MQLAMDRTPVSRTRIAAMILSCIGILMAATTVRAQAGYGTSQVAAESASDRLARYLRILATSPRNFEALIGAGRASLSLGDAQAAAGFFGRADEVWPTSPLPQAGMGAATVLEGDANGALTYFSRAVSLGVTPLTIGADRGLAYDLLGRHAEAQADYQAALLGSDGDEARRRLAISQAITGNKDAALATLSPLLMRRDSGAVRTRALVLAMTGDTISARSAIEAAMPGAWPQMGPFIARLGTLTSGQKAAAANLGIFPGSGPIGSGQTIASAAGSRLADIEALLRAPPPPAVAVPHPAYPSQAMGPPAPPPASVAPAPSGSGLAALAGATATAHRRYWVELSSAPSAALLPQQMPGIRSRSEDLLNGVSAYIAEEPGRARLLVGPFRNASDADIFAEDLETLQVRASRWISPEGQPIRKITN